jgi:hypothetical protein
LTVRRALPLLLGAALLAGCAGREVMRLRSPDGRIDAVLIEKRMGRSADYEVRVMAVDPADGRPGWIMRLIGVRMTAGCPRPYRMFWEREASRPSDNIQWVRLQATAATDSRLAIPPPAFRSGVVLASFAAGGVEPPVCPPAPGTPH